jgi:hypothetical protein
MSDPAPVDQQQALDHAANAPASQEETEHQAALQNYQQADGKLHMHVKVHSPYRSYFDGDAYSLSAENATGPFDVLPRHHNFISLLTPCEVVVRSPGNDDRRIRISGGLLHVKKDQAIIFLDV